MTSPHTRVATICARAGSSGVTDKNIRLLGGIPLIGHAIQQAQKCGLFDAIAVSSDSSHYLEMAKKHGATVLIDRPAELATSLAGKVPAIRHCALAAEELCEKRFDIVVDLDVSTPLRQIADIISTVRILEDKNPDNVVSANKSRKSPYFNLVETDTENRAHICKEPNQIIVARQQARPVYELNGAVYAWWRKSLMRMEVALGSNTLINLMSSENGLDIDSELDFHFVEFVYQRRLQASRQG